MLRQITFAWFVSLTSERPYKQAWPFDRAFAYLEEHACSQFDPVCVEAALRNKEAFRTIHQQYQEPATSQVGSDLSRPGRSSSH